MWYLNRNYFLLQYYGKYSVMKSGVVIRQQLELLKPEHKNGRFRLSGLRNGLLVRMPNHLGDAVMALPALAALKKSLPAECGLFVITPAGNAQLYRAMDFVDDIIRLKKPHKFWSREELRQIRQLHAGAAVLFNHSFRDALCLKLAGVPALYGEPTRNRGCLLKGKISFPGKVKGQYSNSHQTMRYLAIAEAFGGSAPEKLMPEFHIPCGADEISGAVTPLFHHPLLLTLAPGAAYGAAKRWPHEYYAKVALYWIRRGGIVALCGSPAEKEICEAICKELPANKAFNLCGKTDLFALMYIFKFSAFAITNDSGLMHLGSAVGCPGLTVFGPTDLYDTGPVSDCWIMMHDREKCAPCLKRVCPKGDPVCTKKITPSMVIRVLKSDAERLKLPLEKYRHRER